MSVFPSFCLSVPAAAGGFAAEIWRRQQISINNCCCCAICGPRKSWSDCKEVQHSCYDTFVWLRVCYQSAFERTQTYHILPLSFVTPPPTGERSIVVSVSVCQSVCLSVRDHISANTSTRPIFTNFLRLLPMAVVLSSSGAEVTCYELPVLCMTSYLLVSQGCSTSLLS